MDTKTEIILWIIGSLIGIILALIISTKLARRSHEKKEYKASHKVMHKKELDEFEVTMAMPYDFKQVYPKRLKWWQLIKKSRWKRHKDEFIMIIMQLHNGDFLQSMAQFEKNKSFKFRGRRYIIDENKKRYMAFARCFFLFYHEGILVPIDINFPEDDIKNAIKSEIKEIHLSASAKAASDFYNSTVVEKMLTGAVLNKKLSMILIICIVGAAAAVINLLLFLARNVKK